MSTDQPVPGHFVMDPQRAMLLPPELKAALPESLTEQLFIERSLTENQFWLRIMIEHSHFTASLLNQSERNLVHTASKFGDDFEVLLNQGRDIESML
ncbi:hypothetical protein DJ93_5875 [Bacillus clarus]|uniref:Uncharacterized protein n=1 Tax=Bacillus clarus TaxID=2338372 RepID=A0A090Y9I3_9BACI|nr:hypothetical protein DJ93_5875 [Bacillus clarus]